MNVIELYQNNLNDIEKFDKNINSNLNVKIIHDESKYDDEWLCKMEQTIRYLDNILRNPNRFIINDEEIVKIELARRITVDSIKHLSKNTNLIQDFNKKTGEVRPSKILNINKEESFNTYENRFIYTLINNMKMYIERKKNEVFGSFGLKDEKNFNYVASSKMGKKKIDISLDMKSHLEDISNEGSPLARITKLEEQIRDLTSSEVYKNIAKLHVAPVVSPIKKTNLILKNTNFQYALDLWNYMQSHMESSKAQNKYNKNYQDNSNFYKAELLSASFSNDENLIRKATSALCALLIIYNDERIMEWFNNNHHSVQQIEAMCSVLISFLQGNEGYRDISKKLLLKLIQAPSQIDSITSVFDCKFNAKRESDFLIALMNSPQGEVLIHPFLHLLNSSTESIESYSAIIKETGKKIISDLKNADYRYLIPDFIKSTVRLYDNGMHNKEIIEICLNIWDEIYKNNLQGSTFLIDMMDSLKSGY